MVGDYSYTALPTPGHIRLLTLKASKSKLADLHGEIIEYPLHECEGDLHCYEALSYVWGDDRKPRHIWIGTSKLYITENLYTALLCLRNHSADRSLWVDAICINQTDDAEKSVQVQRMANVYSKASRVRVWLGDAADGSDQALHCLADAGAAEGSYELSAGYSELIRKLLAREWFKRVWVLQEVAAAQHVVLMSGATSIDGYAFCVGLQALHKSGKLPDLQNHIGSIVYLIRRSIFRLTKQNWPSSQKGSPLCSLGIQPLGQLIDMYRNHKATDQRDKVFALLGLCSDDVPTNLLPNYSDAMTWDKLLGSLARFVFGAEANIEIVATDIVAVKSGVKILGHVSSVRPDEHRYDMQVLSIITSWNKNQHAYNRAEWIVSTSAVPVQPQDIICILKGTHNIAILRPETDFFRVIMTSGHWGMGSQPDDQDPEKVYEYNLLLSWDWTAPKESLPLYIDSDSTKNALIEDTEATVNLRIIANVFLSAYLDEKAEPILLKLERKYQQQPTADNLAKLDCSAKIVYICLRGSRWDEAEKRYQEVYKHAQATMETKWLSESITQYLRIFRSIEFQRRRIWETLKSAMGESLEPLQYYIKIHKRLAYVFASDTPENARLLLDLGEILVSNLKTAVLLSNGQQNGMINIKSKIAAAEENVVVAAAKGTRKIMELLFEERGDQVLITKDVVLAAARHSRDNMELLFKKRGDQILVTEDVVVAAAGNGKDGQAVMKLLFMQRADKIPVTENVVVAAAGNSRDARGLMELLLEKRGDEVPITENVVVEAAETDYHSRNVMGLLFEKRADSVSVTENVIMAAAGNSCWVMELLLEKRGDEVPITENVVVAAAGNNFEGWEVMSLLLEKRGDEVPITEKVVVAAAGNDPGGRRLMEVLQSKRGGEVPFSKNIIMAGAGEYAGPDVMKLLLEKRGDQIPITENVIKAAASNWTYGSQVIELLFEKRGDMATLSTAKCLASNGAAIPGEPEEAKQLLLEKFKKDRASWYSKVEEEWKKNFEERAP